MDWLIVNSDRVNTSYNIIHSRHESWLVSGMSRAIPIKRHTPVRMKQSVWLTDAYSHKVWSLRNSYKLVTDLHTDLDPQVDATPDWYDAVDEHVMKSVLEGAERKQPLHKRLTKLFKRRK